MSDETVREVTVKLEFRLKPEGCEILARMLTEGGHWGESMVLLPRDFEIAARCRSRQIAVLDESGRLVSQPTVTGTASLAEEALTILAKRMMNRVHADGMLDFLEGVYVVEVPPEAGVKSAEPLR